MPTEVDCSHGGADLAPHSALRIENIYVGYWSREMGDVSPRSHGMPGVQQKFYKISAGLGLTLCFVSANPLEPDPERIWIGILGKGDRVLGPSDVCRTPKTTRWIQTGREPVSWWLEVREGDITDVVSALRKELQ
jgi:hypothetical protein